MEEGNPLLVVNVWMSMLFGDLVQIAGEAISIITTYLGISAVDDAHIAFYVF
jgi:hypothetical protein